MTKERRPNNPPRSVRDIKRAIASIPKEVVEQAMREGEEEFRREIAEIEERRRRELHDYVPHHFIT